VLQYDRNIHYFEFHWTKEGSRGQIQTGDQPSIIRFPEVSEKDFGHYTCEVREAGRIVLTVYKALYKDQGVYVQYVYIYKRHNRHGSAYQSILIIRSWIQDHRRTCTEPSVHYVFMIVFQKRCVEYCYAEGKLK